MIIIILEITLWRTIAKTEMSSFKNIILSEDMIAVFWNESTYSMWLNKLVYQQVRVIGNIIASQHKADWKWKELGQELWNYLMGMWQSIPGDPFYSESHEYLNIILQVNSMAGFRILSTLII